MGVCFTGYCSQNAFKCLLKCVEPKVGFGERPWGGRESPGARSDDAPSLSLPTYSTDREKNQGLISHQNVILGTVWANCDVGTAPRTILALFAAFELPTKGPCLVGEWLWMVLGEGVQGAQQPWGHGLLAAALMGAPDGKEHPCLTSLPHNPVFSSVCHRSVPSFPPGLEELGWHFVLLAAGRALLLYHDPPTPCLSISWHERTEGEVGTLIKRKKRKREGV